MRKIVLLSLLSANCLAAPLEVVNLKAESLSTVGLRNNPVYLTSLHQASVRNNTDQDLNILVGYTICAIRCDSSHHYKIRLKAHGTWQDNIALHLTPSYASPGHFPVSSKTSVAGPYGFYQESYGYGNVQIN